MHFWVQTLFSYFLEPCFLSSRQLRVSSVQIRPLEHVDMDRTDHLDSRQTNV